MKQRGPLLTRWRLTRVAKRREWNGGRCACWIDGHEVYICRNHRAPGSVMGAWADIALDAATDIAGPASPVAGTK